VLDTPGNVSGGGSWNAAGGKRALSVTAQHSALSTSTSGQLAFDNHANGSVTGTVQHLGIDSSNVATVTGLATLNGVAGYGFTLSVADQSAGDAVHLVVVAADGTTVLDESGTLSRGDVVVTRTF